MLHDSTGQTELDMPHQTRVAVLLRAAMEAVTLAMTVLAPWAFASVHPASLFLLYCGLSVTLILWSAAILVEGRVTISWCPVLLCLGAMVALGVWQLIPFSPSALATISAGTTKWRSELYPQELEGLIGEETVFPPGSTISLDPNATRNRVVQLLALFALFAVVRYGIASPATFRRFAVVCVINGALLSLFALAQRFSAPHHILFWSYTTRGDPYGPFVCKNHFPDYVNVCLGLGVGLLLLTPGFRNRASKFGEWLVALGQESRTLWLISAVGIMVTAVLFSLSRGGMMGLAAGALCFLLLAVRTRRFTNSMGLLAAVAILALSSAAWFGADAISQRLSTLTERDPDGSRREVWSRTLPLLARFPLWGTGYGTFMSIETQSLQPGDEQLLDWDHAHNDYLETAIEGGLISLVLMLLGLGFVYGTGIRALNRLRDHPNGTLVLGGLSGLTAVAFHNFADFGMHIPAVVVLLTVLIGHLSAQGESNASPRHQSVRWLVLPVIAACWIVAAVLPIDGWFRERAEYYRLAALRAGNRLSPGERDPVIRYLYSAAEFEPDNPDIRSRLAEAEYEEYQVRRDQSQTPESMNELVQSYLRPALRDCLKLRASNPLYANSHARLAGNRQFLQHPDSVSNYLDRATRLRPTDESLWFLAGLNHIAGDGDVNRAWEDWRCSLVCSPRHLPRILPVAIASLGPSEVVDRVLPLDPTLLFQAAQTPPLSENEADRRAFSARAVERIAELSLAKKDDLYARAWLLRETGQTTAAVEAYECALRKAPDSLDWRFELAEMLFASGDLAEAERQLRKVLQAQPDREEARELNASIVRAKTRTQ